MKKVNIFRMMEYLEDMPLTVFDWIGWRAGFTVPTGRVVHVKANGRVITWGEAAMLCIDHGDVRQQSIGRVAMSRTREGSYYAPNAFKMVMADDETYWGVYFWQGVYRNRADMIVRGIELRDQRDVCGEMWMALMASMQTDLVCVAGENLNMEDMGTKLLMCDDTRAESYAQLAAFYCGPSLRSHAGCRMRWQDLTREALRLDPTCVTACRMIAQEPVFDCECEMSKWVHVHLDDAQTVLPLYAIYTTLMATKSDGSAAAGRLYELCVIQQPEWSRLLPMEMWGVATNRLFGAMLLGMNRLETTGVIATTHASMLEDMLETWKFRDSVRAGCVDGAFYG